MRRAREELAELADSGIVQSLVEHVARQLAEAHGDARQGEILDSPSDAELGVLQLLMTDLSTRQIAQQLFLSPNTVRSHTRSIYRKLGVNSRENAVARATALGLMDEAQSPR